MAAFRHTIIAIAAMLAAVIFAAPNASAQLAKASAAATTSGLKQYTDPKYGFSFWYPAALQITVTAAKDDTSFPGGTTVETVQVGPAGGVAVHVVNSPHSALTDEPNGHATPIAQTRFFVRRGDADMDDASS
jgi:hypothetical protein